MEMVRIILLIFINIVCAEYEARNQTTVTYDPAELLSRIFNNNKTTTKHDSVDDEFLDNQARQYGLIFENAEGPIKFQDDPSTVQNTDYIEQPHDLEAQKKKRRRRRRKPKNQQLLGYGNLAYPANGAPGFGLNPYLNPGYHAPSGQANKPPRYQHRRPSLASGALSAISGALASIALNDDYQCVPRLLCEAAGGGALGSSSLLQSVTGLQPMLTLLSAYNGISTSPLFVFGRAVFLGMTSKGNTASCRYAYPQCPTDPEQLVHYLNNHNGGFFRFFNAPSLQQGQQNLEQFYSQLSGQNYGLYQPNFEQDDHSSHFSHGLQRPGLYSKQKYYGSGYNYVKYNNNDDFKGGFAERIQNTPSRFISNDDFDDAENSKWSFPDDDKIYMSNKYVFHNNENNIRGGKSLKFPDEIVHNGISSVRETLYENYENNVQKDYVRKGKSILFPDNQNQDYNKNNKYVANDLYIYPPTSTVVNHDDYEFDYKHNFYVKKDKNEEDGVKTIYVVRGNGDPNNPEVVRIRPGQPYHNL